MLKNLTRTLVGLSLVGLVTVACSDDETTGPSTNPPTAPTNVAVSAVADAVTVTWTLGTGATSHLVELRRTNPDTLTKTVGGSETSAVFTEEDGVTDEASYVAAVFAINSAGTVGGDETTDTTDVDWVISGCDTPADQIDPAQTLRFESSILWNNVDTGDADQNFADASGDGYNLEENQAFFETAAFNNLVADPNLPDEAFTIGTRLAPPDFIPSAMPAGYTPFDVSALNSAAGLVPPTDGRTLQATTYAGAVEPGTALADAWYYGWTVWATDGSDSRAGLADTITAGASIDTVTGVIGQDTTWTVGNPILIRGPVFVGTDIGFDGQLPGGNSVTLTIQAGATIYGDVNPPEGARGSYLVVTRGSQLIADATGSFGERPTDDNVIVFTSSKNGGERARADWGGVVLNGRAPINSGDEAIGEGGSGLYGGPDTDDSSGLIRGVRIEFAGDRVTATDELNGLALQGSGAGTTVDYLQIHYNEDDGTEPFGGSTTQTHVVVTGIADDSFDGTDAYQGFMQFLIAQQRADDADQGFEISNNGDDPAASPKSSAIVANATMIGSGVSGLGSGEISALGTEGDVGALFREGSHYRLFNHILVGFGVSGFDVEGAQTAQNADCRIGR